VREQRNYNDGKQAVQTASRELRKAYTADDPAGDTHGNENKAHKIFFENMNGPDDAQ
jgi:hypothetical protein